MQSAPLHLTGSCLSRLKTANPRVVPGRCAALPGFLVWRDRGASDHRHLWLSPLACVEHRASDEQFALNRDRQHSAVSSISPHASRLTHLPVSGDCLREEAWKSSPGEERNAAVLLKAGIFQNSECFEYV